MPNYDPDLVRALLSSWTDDTLHLRTPSGKTFSLSTSQLEGFVMLRVWGGGPGDKIRQMVECPDGHGRMHYQPINDMMVCQNDNCHNVSVRSARFDPAFGIPRNGEDVPIYRGSYQLVQDENGRNYLYLIGLGRLIDITDFLRDGESSPLT